MPEKKREEAGFLSRSEKQKLQKLYSKNFAAYGSVKNLTRGSKLPVSKVQYFFHSKSSYTTFNQATRRLRRMRAFPRFNNESWCMDLAFVDKLPKKQQRNKIFARSPRHVCQNGRCKRNENKRFKRNRKKFFQNGYKKESTIKSLGQPRYRICRRFQKVLCCRQNTCLLHNEWNKSNLCRENHQVTQKYPLQIYGGKWIKIYSQFVSVCQDTEFEKKSHDKHGTKQSQGIQVYVDSLWLT